MSLNNLEKKLYDPDSGIERRKHESSQFDPMIYRRNGSDIFRKEKVWKKPVDPNAEERKKIIRIGAIALGAIILLALLVVGLMKFWQSSFRAGRVTVKIEGPVKVDSSTESEFKIFFKNENRKDLKAVQLLLNYPENFKIKERSDLKVDNPSNSRIDIGTLKANSGGEIVLKGSFIAVKNATVYLNATLQYSPGNSSSVFQSKGQLGVNVESSPLFLEIQAPMEVVDGNKVDYVVDYRNLTTEYLDKIRVKADYPEGFSFISSDPSPSENNGVWYLGSLEPEKSGKVVISGTMSGTSEESKTIKVYIGYTGENGEFVISDQKDKSTKMTSTMLSISQLINNGAESTVDAGENLEYKIQYKNNGNISLKDAIVTLEIDSLVLDFSKLESNGGFYDASKKMITWKAAEIPELANLNPGQEGKITFSVPVLDRIPVGNSNDKNFTVVSTAKIDSPSIPTPIGSNKTIASNRMELKLNSRAVLEVKGYYKDSNMENSGSIPPKNGQETTYTMHWKIINVSNDISNTKVVSYVPSGVKWTGKTYPEGESITFNERTNQIEWEVGNLKNGVGIIDPAREVSFQISVTPQVNQVGKALILLNPSILTANDVFTNKEIRFETVEKDNRIPEDGTIGEKFKVVE